MDEQLEKAVQESLVNGYLPCGAAFKVAARLKVSLTEVGNFDAVSGHLASSGLR